jgi:hypothetical protein
MMAGTLAILLDYETNLRMDDLCTDGKTKLNRKNRRRNNNNLTSPLQVPNLPRSLFFMSPLFARD